MKQPSSFTQSLDMLMSDAKKNSLKKTVNFSQKSSWKKDLLKTKGEVFDLKEIFESINQEYFENKIDAKITWARKNQKAARCYRRLGCFMPLKNLIKINPILDSLQIPAYFIAFIVYHEMLHAACPPIQSQGKRLVHHKKFKLKEKSFKDFEKAKVWEKEHARTVFFK